MKNWTQLTLREYMDIVDIYEKLKGINQESDHLEFFELEQEFVSIMADMDPADIEYMMIMDYNNLKEQCYKAFEVDMPTDVTKQFEFDGDTYTFVLDNQFDWSLSQNIRMENYIKTKGSKDSIPYICALLYINGKFDPNKVDYLADKFLDIELNKVYPAFFFFWMFALDGMKATQYFSMLDLLMMMMKLMNNQMTKEELELIVTQIISEGAQTNGQDIQSFMQSQKEILQSLNISLPLPT